MLSFENKNLLFINSETLRKASPFYERVSFLTMEFMSNIGIFEGTLNQYHYSGSGQSEIQ